jgi:hypothetical protein
MGGLENDILEACSGMNQHQDFRREVLDVLLY